MILKARERPDRESPRSRHRFARLRSLLIDTCYLFALSLLLPYLVVVGKGGVVWEHIRRRVRDYPEREGDRPCLWIHGTCFGVIMWYYAMISIGYILIRLR